MSPETMDKLVDGIPNAEQGFRLIFSAQEVPGYTHKLVWKREDANGNWYYSPQYNQEGWLCPALLKYFKDAPGNSMSKQRLNDSRSTGVNAPPLSPPDFVGIIKRAIPGMWGDFDRCTTTTDRGL